MEINVVAVGERIFEVPETATLRDVWLFLREHLITRTDLVAVVIVHNEHVHVGAIMESSLFNVLWGTTSKLRRFLDLYDLEEERTLQ